MRSQLVCVALGALCGCLQEQPTSPVPPAENRAAIASPSWQLRVAHSGGLLGLAQEFELDSATETIVAHDRQRSASASRPLTAAELTELDRLLAAAAQEPEQEDAGGFASSSCADCFQTELQGVYGERRLAARSIDDASASPYDELIARALEYGRPLLQQTQ